MSRVMMLIAGHDRPGSLVDILEQLVDIRIEAAWLRAVGNDAGGIMLLLNGDGLSLEELNALADRAQKQIERAVNSTDPLSSSKSMHPVVIPCTTTPPWDTSFPQLVFSIIGPPPNQDSFARLIKFMTRPRDDEFDAPVVNYDISQHDSGWLSSAHPNQQTQVRNTFRLSQLTAPAVGTLADGRYELQKLLQRSLVLSTNSSGRYPDHRIEYNVPSSRQMVPGLPPSSVYDANEVARWYAVRLIVPDARGRFERLYEIIGKAGLDIDRSCCRGLGGLGLLIFAGRLSHPLLHSNRNDLESKIYDRLIKAEIISGDTSLSKLLPVSVKQLNTHPFDFYCHSEPPYKAVNVFSTSFVNDSKGLLFAVSRLLVSRNGDEGAVYWLDGTPSVEHPNRFSVRMGILYKDVSVAKVRAMVAISTLLAKVEPFESCDRVSCETFELDRPGPSS